MLVYLQLNMYIVKLFMHCRICDNKYIYIYNNTPVQYLTNKIQTADHNIEVRWISMLFLTKNFYFRLWDVFGY